MTKRVTALGSDNWPDDNKELENWLQDQVIPSHPDQDCSAKFRMNLMEDGTYRLFHGHECGETLNYTLTTMLYFPSGTWNSDKITGSSQDVDSCQDVEDGFEECSFTLSPDHPKLAIQFGSDFSASDVAQIHYTTFWTY
jgi:hypothetical protein